MVNFTEIKEQITASFENGKGFPTDLALDGPTVGEFLAGLDLDGSALEFAQPDDQTFGDHPPLLTQTDKAYS